MLVQEHSIRAALYAEAGEARVPTEELLKRIRKAAAMERRSRWPQGFRFWRVAEAVAACALLGVLALLPGLRTGGGAGSRYVTSKLVPYENTELGVRLSVPDNFSKPSIDSQGRLDWRFGPGLLMIGRQAHQLPPGGVMVIDGEVGRIAVEGKATLAGRPASYFRFPTVEFFVVPVGNVDYVVQCGVAANAGRGEVDWASLQPVCDRLLSTLELGGQTGSSQSETDAVRAELERRAQELQISIFRSRSGVTVTQDPIVLIEGTKP